MSKPKSKKYFEPISDILISILKKGVFHAAVLFFCPLKVVISTIFCPIKMEKGLKEEKKAVHLTEKN